MTIESPTRKPASPTMTMMTKAATEEVYEMFNQPLKSDRHSDSEDEEENDVFNDDDDYSITNTNTNTRSQNVSALDSQNTNTDSNFEKSIGMMGSLHLRSGNFNQTNLCNIAIHFSFAISFSDFEIFELLII